MVSPTVAEVFSPVFAEILAKNEPEALRTARLNAWQLVASAAADPFIGFDLNPPCDATAESDMAAGRIFADSVRTKGVLVGNLNSLEQLQAQDLGAYFNKLVNGAADLYIALNTALWKSGTAVTVPAGVNFEIPVQAVRDHHTRFLDRQLIIVESGAHLEYVSGCVSDAVPPASSVTIPVVEIFVRDNASLSFVELENLAFPRNNLGQTIIKLGTNAKLHLAGAYLGQTSRIRPLQVVASAGALISGTLLIAAPRGAKEHMGIEVRGTAQLDVEVHVIGNAGQVSFSPQATPLSVTQHLGMSPKVMPPEALIRALAAFPFELAAEIEAALT